MSYTCPNDFTGMYQHVFWQTYDTSSHCNSCQANNFDNELQICMQMFSKLFQWEDMWFKNWYSNSPSKHTSFLLFTVKGVKLVRTLLNSSNEKQRRLGLSTDTRAFSERYRLPPTASYQQEATAFYSESLLAGSWIDPSWWTWHGYLFWLSLEEICVLVLLNIMLN